MRNTISNATLVSRIDELASKRKAWENGTYKASNEELCALLDECFTLYMEVRMDRTLIKRVGGLLAERGLKTQTNTSLATRIVLLVFGDCGKRKYTYARVLMIAAEEKRENESMLTFVNNARGIENLRRRQVVGQTAKELNEQLCEFAYSQLASGQALIDSIGLTDELMPNTESAYQFSVALVRHDKGKKGSIVYALNNEKLVKAALISAARALKPKKEAAEVDAKRAKQKAKRKEVIERIAA